MNWKKAIKKTIKYTTSILVVLLIVGMFWADREGKRMYGAFTEIVDHTQFEPQTGAFAIHQVNVLAVDGTEFLKEQTVLIQAGKITAIGSDVVLPEEVKIIDGSGKFLIPGLIDAHVHLFKSPNDLLLYLANGVTEIRELIGEEDHLKWRAEIENGRVGPSMFVASPRLGSFENMEGYFMEKTQGFRNVQNAEQARALVQEMKDSGYDGLKLYSHLNKEAYLALTETAKELDMPTFGHIPFSIEFDDVWTSGQSDIAHFEEVMNALQREFSDKERQSLESQFGGFKSREEAFLAYVNQRSSALADSLLKYDISITSTLWLTQSFLRQKVELDKVLTEVALAYENPGISEGTPMVTRALGWLPTVNRFRFHEGMNKEEKAGNIQYWQAYGDACQLLAKNFAAKGVKIMAGTDANLPPTVPGFSLHDELISLNKAGMTETQVLQAATTIPAHWLKSNTGTIKKGYIANLVLLDKNPLENIQHTKAINTVIANGRVFDRMLLNEMLAAVKAANDASRKVDISQYQQKETFLTEVQ